MLCLYCKKRIGLLRRLTDGEYCCADHRVRMRSQSARALRDSGDRGDIDETTTVYVNRTNGPASSSPPSQRESSGFSTVFFGLLLAVAIYVGASGYSGGGGSSPRAQNAEPTFSGIRGFLRSRAAVRLSDDFSTGLNSWVPASKSGGNRDWSFKDGVAHPSRLRLLKDSLRLSNYNIDFAGQIDQKSLSWAFRARDDKNFYAGKLVVAKPGPLPAVDLVRYAMVNGAESRRVRLPLPMIVRPDSVYRVQVAVKGNEFSTVVNGQMVDTWSDDRLRSGGVGFFADAGESASLRYITVTDKDTVLGRILSHFGLFYIPR